jgi:hypothetical protein
MRLCLNLQRANRNHSVLGAREAAGALAPPPNLCMTGNVSAMVTRGGE